jgi:hypothetical protein
MSDAGSLTIYDKYGRQVAATGSSLGTSPSFSNHATIAVKNGGAKVAFFYSGPEGRSSDMAMQIAQHVAFRK